MSYESASSELMIFADNDGRLFQSSFKPIVAALRKKVARGTYSPALARKMWMYHADRAAKEYARQYGGVWNKLFPVAARKHAAADWESRTRGAHPNDSAYIGITQHDRSRRGRSRRDAYRAKRGTYGGMCLCPCPGEKHPPTMATFDPEDPYYSGDRTRKRARSADRTYETTIGGLRVTIRWSPKARRYERGVDHGPGLWVATIHGKSGGTLPGGSGISPLEAEQRTRKLLQGARASNDRTRKRVLTHCPKCGADTWGQPGRCPGCGTHIPGARVSNDRSRRYRRRA